MNPDETETELGMVTPGEAQTIADLATRGVEPRQVDPAGLYVVPDGNGVRVLQLEHLAAAPFRKRGRVTVRDAASFCRYLNKHQSATEGTEVWADPATLNVVGVLDDHGDEPGWGQHRVNLGLIKTPAWLAWKKHDGELVDQQTLAEHLEQRLVDIREPAGADMLELAQTFQATKSAAFESSQRLSSGEVQLAYKEDIEAKAGRSGRLSIPETFTLALMPFEGSQAYKVRARFRYRLHGQSLRIAYVLERPEDVLRAAFDDVVDAIGKGVSQDVLYGLPREA